MKLRLIVQSGPLAGRECELEQGEILLGHGENSALSFAGDSRVSSRHAVVQAQADGFYLTDQQSANGSFINGARVQQAQLNPGDVIQLGENGPQLQVVIEATAPAPVAVEQPAPIIQAATPVSISTETALPLATIEGESAGRVSVMTALSMAMRSLFGNWRALATFVGLYLALLLALYWFFALRESSIPQLLLTLVLAVIAPVLFFVLQAMSVSYTTGETQPGALVKRALHGWWKLLLLSLPLLLLAWGVAALLDWGEGNVTEKMEAARAAARSAKSSLAWVKMVFTILRFLLLYLALPLIAVQLWITASRASLGTAIKDAGRSLLRALSPRTLLTYLIGFVIFAVIPYFLFFTRTPAKNVWLEMSLFGARLALALLFILLGWVVTLGALAKLSVFGEGESISAPTGQ